MNARDAKLLRLIQARIRQMQPEVARALLETLRRVADLLTDAEIRAMLNRTRSIESVLNDAALRAATAPYGDAIQRAVERGIVLTRPDLPLPSRVAVGVVRFDVLNPSVIAAVRDLSTAATDALKSDVREVTRAFVENGIRDGVNSSVTARDLRATIGLSPTQEGYIRNLERELRELSPRFKDRVLRDRRYDRTIARAIREGRPLSEAQIRQMVDAYRRRFTAHHAAVVSRQTTLDAYRVGQRLAWQQSIESGAVLGELWKTWVHSDQPKYPRPEHVAMNGTTVPFDEPYPTPERHMCAGEGDWGCYCGDRYSIRPRRASRPTVNL